ncbi:hypothetical protein CYQ88_03025 [Hydrogenovibrio sp. SC-1]|uniref:ATP-grasp domain-containing protein n=1 Tax=Hydrogenovibrio sp. SC-1 TaxID=2065820 RepID=UPI000C7BA37F|nr:ATP-grasp domain-containing protein [Hydrogenovibrio sp. SC-1]PLA74892.1 hypothetical protein CYQ88_03025 [Hydrogenovibrio sp. SC-1]
MLKNRNLLITSVSKKVGLVKAFIKEAKKENIKVFGADVTKDAVALYFCDNFFILPHRNDADFLCDLVRNCKKRRIKFILPTSDGDLIFFAKNRTILSENNIEVLMSGNTSINICTSKLAFNQHCKQNGLPIPYSYDSLNLVKYPVIIKEEFSQASKGVYIAENKDQAIEIIKVLPVEKYLIQEFVLGQEYSIDAFFDNEGCVKAVLPRSRDLVVGGESVITTSVDLPELEILVKDLGETLNLFGHIVVQAFFHDGVVSLVEANLRFGGASGLAFVTGVNSPKWLVEYMVGKKSYSVSDIKYNVKMFKYSSEYILGADID